MKNYLSLALIVIGSCMISSCYSSKTSSEVLVINKTNRDVNIMLQHLYTRHNSFSVRVNEPIKDSVILSVLLLKDGKRFKYDFNNEVTTASLYNDNFIPKKGEEGYLKNYFSEISVNVYITDLDYLMIKDAPKKSYRYSFDIKNDEAYSGVNLDVPKKGWSPMQLRILNSIEHPIDTIPLFCYISLEDEGDNVDDIKINNLRDIWKLSLKRNIIVAFLVKDKYYSKFLERTRELSNSVQTNPTKPQTP